MPADSFPFPWRAADAESATQTELFRAVVDGTESDAQNGSLMPLPYATTMPLTVSPDAFNADGILVLVLHGWRGHDRWTFTLYPDGLGEKALTTPHGSLIATTPTTPNRVLADVGPGVMTVRQREFDTATERAPRPARNHHHPSKMSL